MQRTRTKTDLNGLMKRSEGFLQKTLSGHRRGGRVWWGAAGKEAYWEEAMLERE